MNNIIRVFPRKTNMTPIDDFTFIGMPTLFIPDHKAIHISCTFTWDIEYSLRLQKEWGLFTTKPVLVGGPAFGDITDNFKSGMYLKNNIVITSTGCPNKCKHCLVPEREGSLKEINITDGNIIQDNNLLACSDNHIADVFEMLSHQKGIKFSGGFEALRVDLNLINQLKKLSISEIWLACDTPQSFKTVKSKIELLRSEGFSQNKIRCYVIIGQDKEEESKRLINLYKCGCLPFAQLLQPNSLKKLEYSREWKKFNRYWSKPIIYKSDLGRGTCKN